MQLSHQERHGCYCNNPQRHLPCAAESLHLLQRTKRIDRRKTSHVRQKHFPAIHLRLQVLDVVQWMQVLQGYLFRVEQRAKRRPHRDSFRRVIQHARHLLELVPRKDDRPLKRHMVQMKFQRGIPNKHLQHLYQYFKALKAEIHCHLHGHIVHVLKYHDRTKNCNGLANDFIAIASDVLVVVIGQVGHRHEEDHGTNEGAGSAYIV
mmetsp:Transcript_11565/g.21921  ORF Transcript_11565/g.21921 Transcript_11565/m.21921 type:complete len:206 (-) Transcript_11565:59-676(-)